jgi:hypothetical protein
VFTTALLVALLRTGFGMRSNCCLCNAVHALRMPAKQNTVAIGSLTKIAMERWLLLLLTHQQRQRL